MNNPPDPSASDPQPTNDPADSPKAGDSADSSKASDASTAASSSAQSDGSQRSGPGKSRWLIIGGVVALVLVAAGVFVVVGGNGSSSDPSASIPKEQPVSPEVMARLPRATTFSTVPGAPSDTAPFASPDGTVVHPETQKVVYSSPGGPPIAVLPSQQLNAPTWVPVVQSAPGWYRILLPSRPNRASGWVASYSGNLQAAKSPYLVKVEIGARRVTLLRDGQPQGTWKAAVGTPKTPTPLGRTFLLAVLTPSKPTYSSIIMPTGFHSDTLETFGGGPGTAAFHTWPDPKVFGQAVTHGCVRVPADALTVLSKVPLGSPVVISA